MTTLKRLEKRHAVGARLLGREKTERGRFGKKEMEYAVEVVLSDESQYTIFRSLKEVASVHARMISRFPVEAGYFKKEERVISECPVKQTVFGLQRLIRDDKSFEKLLNSYVKELPGLPASIVKGDIIQKFFALRSSDVVDPTTMAKNEKQKTRAREQIVVSDASTISGPRKLRSYYTVVAYTDKKKFSFSEGAIVQVLQKDTSGWWMVDANGIIGWAPASYLVPVDEEDLEETAENEQLVPSEKVGARYISMSSYQSSRDDELSFVRGAVVRVIKQYVDGWWLVRYNGGEGFVPGSLFRKFDKRQASIYVNKIKRNFISRKSTRIMPTVRPKWSKAHSGGNNGSHGLVLYQCIATFIGSPSRFEITLNKNDRVKVLDKKDHGWWYVQDQHGRSGWAPATYLKQIIDTTAHFSKSFNRITGFTFKVIQNHHAQQEDELSVHKDDSVIVLDTSDDGWWNVKNVATQQQGIVPSVYLKETTEVSHTLSEVPEESCDDEDGDEVGDEAEVNSEDSELARSVSLSLDGEEDEDDTDIDEMEFEGCYVAIKDYSKDAIDQLDVYEGQVVCVIDNTHKDMWYVNIDGKEGWLPSSLLQIMADDGLLDTSGGSSLSGSRNESTETSAEPSDSEEPLRKSSLPHFLPRSSPVLHMTSTEYKKHHSVPRREISAPVYIHNSDSDIVTSSGSPTPVTILVGNKTLEDLEKEVEEAEKVAKEARLKAQFLKHEVEKAKRASGSNFDA